MFYTYIWRDASGVPFYVGKGSNRRAYTTNQRSADFTAEYEKGGCTVEIADEFILESQAHAHEVDLIEIYGRRDTGGLLVNKTDGGDGTSGYVHSAETREKQSAAHLKRWKDPSERAKMSAGQIRRYADPAEREKNSAARRGKPKSPEAVVNMAAAQISRYAADPTAREKTSAAARFAPTRANNSSGFKGVYFHKYSCKWAAVIKKRHLGIFPTPEEAASAYDRAAIDAWGYGNCYVNFPTQHAKAA